MAKEEARMTKAAKLAGIATLMLAGCAGAQRTYMLAVVSRSVPVEGTSWFEREYRVVGYAVEDDGSLTAVPSDVVLGGNEWVTSLVSVPASHRVHVAQADRLSTLDLDPGDGRVTLVGSRPAEVHAIHPSARLVYGWMGTSNSIAGYTVNPETGEIGEPLPGSPYTRAGGRATSAAFGPSGRYLWASTHSTYKAGGIVSFLLEPDSGALRHTGEIGTYDRDGALAVDPRETMAFYVSASRFLEVLRIDPISGALAKLSTWPLPQGTSLGSLNSSPSGRWLLGLMRDRADAFEGVAVYEVSAGGSVTSHARLGFDRPASLTVSDSRVFVWSANALAVLRFDDKAGTLDLLRQVTRPTDERVERALVVRLR